MDEQEIKKILEEAGKASDKKIEGTLKKLSDAITKGEKLSGPTIKNINAELKNYLAQLKLSPTEYQKVSRQIDATTNSLEAMSEASDKFEKSLYASYRAAGKSRDEATILAKRHEYLSGKMSALGDAISKGEGKLTDYTAIFAKDGAFGENLAKLGAGLQTTIDDYRQLSSVGASFAQNMIAMRNAAGAAGLPLKDFVGLVKDNSVELASLYGTTSEGAKQFGILSKEFRDASTDSLIPLGYSVADLNKALINYTTLQRRLGNLEVATQADTTKSAVAFELEIDKLAKMTGLQRQGIEKQLQEQLSNERFQAQISSLRASGDKAAADRLQIFAAGVGKLSPQLATGIQDLIANAGSPVTQAGLELYQNMPELSDVIGRLQAGSITSAQAMQEMAKLARESGKNFQGATQTGLVGFTRLQAPLQDFGNKILDSNKATAEQLAAQDRLTKSMANFENAAKNLTAGFQSLETGFYAFFGDALGTGGGILNKGIQKIGEYMQGLSNTTKAILYVGGTLSKYLFDKALQIFVVRTGTYLALMQARGTSLGQSLRDSFGISTTPADKGPGAAGRFGTFVSNNRLKFAGAGLAAGMGADLLGSALKDAGQDTAGGVVSTLGSAATFATLGAEIGSIFPGLGTAIGAVAGGLLGAGLGMYQNFSKPNATPGMATGGSVYPNRSYMVGEKGPELFTPAGSGNITSNAALAGGVTMYQEQIEQTNKHLSQLVKLNKDLLDSNTKQERYAKKTAGKTGDMLS